MGHGGTQLLTYSLIAALTALVGAVGGLVVWRHQRRMAQLSAALGLTRSGWFRWAASLPEGGHLEVVALPLRLAELQLQTPLVLTLRPRDPVADLAHPSVVLGDVDFEAKVHVSGDKELALAILDAPKRKVIADLLMLSTLHTTADGVNGRVPLRSLVANVERARQLARGLQRPPGDPLLHLLERWRDEPQPGVRAMALHALLRSSTTRAQATQLARDDEHPAVLEALASSLDDWDALLALLVSGADEEVSERIFRKLRALDSDRLALGLLHAAGHAAIEIADGAVRRIGRLRSPQVLEQLLETLPELETSGRLARYGGLFLGAVSGVSAGADVADLAVQLLRKVPDVDVWHAGLSVLQSHGSRAQLQQVASLPLPDGSLVEPLEATRQRIEARYLVEEIVQRYGFEQDLPALRGVVDGIAIVTLLEPERGVVRTEGLDPQAHLVPRPTEPMGSPFHVAFETEAEGLTWSPTARRQVQALQFHGMVLLRAGRLMINSRRLDPSVVQLIADLANTLKASGRQDPAEVLRHLVATDDDPHWLVQWLKLARKTGLSYEAPPPRRSRRVALYDASWRGDVDALDALFREPIDAALRKEALAERLSHDDSSLRRALDDAPQLALRVIAAHAQPSRTSLAMDWLHSQPEPTSEERHQVLELSLRAPHPTAEPLWIEALSTTDLKAEEPLRLLEALTTCGGVAGAKALRDTQQRLLLAGKTASAERVEQAYDAIAARLSTAGALSVAGGGELSLAAEAPANGALTLTDDGAHSP